MAHGLILRMNKTNMTLYVDLFPANLSAEGHNGRIQPIDTCDKKTLSEQQLNIGHNMEMKRNSANDNIHTGIMDIFDPHPPDLSEHFTIHIVPTDIPQQQYKQGALTRAAIGVYKFFITN